MRDMAEGDIARVVVNRSQSLHPHTKKPLVPGDLIMVQELIESKLWKKTATYVCSGKEINISGQRFNGRDAIATADLELIGCEGETFVLQTNPPDFAKDIGRIEDENGQRYLRAGDVIKSTQIFLHCFKDGQHHYLSGFNGSYYVCVSCLKRHEIGSIDKCICDTRDLMLGGCACGFMKRAKIGAGK